MRRTINILANTDWLTVILYLLLVAFGWMNIYSVNYTENTPNFFSFENRYTTQLVWVVISIGVAIAIFLIDSRFYMFIAYPMYGLSLLFLILVLVFGREINGAKSWLFFGPVSIQPSELAKVATVLTLARFLSTYNIKTDSFKNIIISGLIILGPILFIALQPDFGSILVYFALIFVLYREGLPGWVLLLLVIFAALFLGWFLIQPILILILLTIISFIGFAIINKNNKNLFAGIGILLATLIVGYTLSYLNILPRDNYFIYFISLSVAVAISLILAIRKKVKGVFIVVLLLFAFIGYIYSINFVFNNFLQPHHRDRVKVMLGLMSDPYGYEYNVNQSKIAIGSGGFAGRGFMQGPITRLKYVPEQSTDFIFCTVGEEWGFIGSFALIFVYVGLLIRVLFLAERQRSRFSRVYGYGVLAILFFHFAVNIAMTISLFPVIGIPLPFLSYGGSSLMSFTILLFIFLRLDSTRKAYLI